MKKRWMRKLAWMMALMLLLCGCSSGNPPAAAQPDGGNGAASAPGGDLKLTFAANSIGGSWYNCGVSISDILADTLGASTDVLPYNGGIGNPLIIANGEASLGLAFSVTQNWAYNGTNEYDAPCPNLRSMVGGLGRNQRIAVIVNEKLGISSLREVKDQKMKISLFTAQIGSLGEALTRQTLAVYGMSYEDIKAWGGTVTHADQSVAVEQVQDGVGDMIIYCCGYMETSIVEMTLRGGFDFLPLEDDVRSTLCQEYGYVNDIYIEKGEFTGVDEDVITCGFPNTILTNDAMSEETAYQITKAICENADTLTASHASLETFDPAKAGSEDLNGYIPLHPGSERYYKEMGYLS